MKGWCYTTNLCGGFSQQIVSNLGPCIYIPYHDCEHVPCVCVCDFYLVIYLFFEWIAQLKLVRHILLLFGTMQLQYNVPIFFHGYLLFPRS